MNPIVTCIDIKDQTREQVLRKGGYSSLILATYHYIPQLSINEGVVKQQARDEEPVLLRSSLVKKVSDLTQANKSLLN